MTGLPAWAVREPDELAEHWVIRLAISYAAIRAALTRTETRR